jgi:formiminotetrahydrofolate cyclodeaminase
MLVESVAIDILRMTMKNFITWYYLNILNSFIAPTDVDKRITLLNAAIENGKLTVQVGLDKLDDTSVSCSYQFDLTK